MGRADLYTWLRPARGSPPALLAGAHRVPVHPRLAQRAVVRALPRSRPERDRAGRPSRMANPAAARSRRADDLGGQQLPTPHQVTTTTMTAGLSGGLAAALVGGLVAGPSPPRQPCGQMSQ